MEIMRLFNVFQAARKRKIEEKEIYYVRYKVNIHSYRRVNDSYF